MRTMVTGGGTGGHVYPALSALDALVADEAHAAARASDILWVGSVDGVERDILGRTAYAYAAVSTGPLRGANPLQALRSVAQIARGTREALALVERWKPEAVLATGGYVSVPLALAARLRHVPLLLYLPDMEPGLAVKLLARIAARVAVSFEPAAAFFGRKAVVTGYPVRQALFDTDRRDARQQLALAEDEPVVLVMGGSRGARSINQAVQAGLTTLLARAQLVHVTGPLDFDALRQAQQTLPAELAARYHVYAYLHEEMVPALVAADLVIARSGAATLGELPAVGAPAILVPYPYAGQHQRLNAAYLADAGAAVVLEDEHLGEELLPTLLRLLDDPATLSQMSAAARAKSVPDAARRIAQELVAIARGEEHD
ncbi:MAG: undecaprenyldiphospho-muramoylpentapeptide beta-N-acetylglucosaminyltransferase [Anaerolineales bacterium]